MVHGCGLVLKDHMALFIYCAKGVFCPMAGQFCMIWADIKKKCQNGMPF